MFLVDDQMYTSDKNWGNKYMQMATNVYDGAGVKGRKKYSAVFLENDRILF